MKEQTKLILKGFVDNGEPFTKEIHSLDEVKSSGNFLVVGRNISPANGLPAISGKTHDCFCCEAQLTVTCCYPENESQSDTAYGQTLTICDRETGVTATYSRSISPTKNGGMWTPWQMVATGDVELITGNNQLNETLTILGDKIDSEIVRSQQTDDEIWTNMSRMEIKSSSINLAVNDGSTVRFHRIEENEVTVNKEKLNEPNEVVFYKPDCVFLATDSNGNYYDTWSDSEQYMSRGAIRKNKVYICGTDIFVWDGEKLINIIENINNSTEEINDQTKAFLVDKIETEKRALKNGDTIVGLSREIYSRQGKTDSATFLRRTTAGGTSVSDGVASIKQIGGNILKNFADGTFISNDNYNRESAETLIFTNNTCLITTSSANIKYGGIKTKSGKFIIGHIYYASVYVFNVDALSIEISIDGGSNSKTFTEKGRWIRASMVEEKKSTSENLNNATIRLRKNEGGIVSARVCNWLVIDLTEHFGAGNEPTLEECDKMFASVGPLPQGLFIAQPTGFKSIGYNHWNPENVIVGKNVVNSQITTNEGTSIAVVKCVPCKEGVGENNGYVIGYGEAENWSDDGIEVYLSPLNPMETSGELFLQKLEKSTAQTYIPDIGGYLLIVTPVTEKLCAHLHWSADRATTDYEPYIESVVSLPNIPEMSEWGLAAAGSVRDCIDFEKMEYSNLVNRVDLGSLSWNYNAADETHPHGYLTATIEDAKFSSSTNVITEAYCTCADFSVDKSIIAMPASNTICIVDSSYTDVDKLGNSLNGMYAYYEKTPEKYSIVTKSAPNYIGSDYGVEEFVGSQTPVGANTLYYMRSLVSEVRNFLDRLMSWLGSDVVAVADRIIASISSTETNIVAMDNPQ